MSNNQLNDFSNSLLAFQNGLSSLREIVEREKEKLDDEGKKIVDDKLAELAKAEKDLGSSIITMTDKMLRKV